MAIPAIMIGINQGIMMALAMEVVTPLIGGKGLGLKLMRDRLPAEIDPLGPDNLLVFMMGVILLSVCR